VRVTITAVDRADPAGARLRRADLEERGKRPLDGCADRPAAQGDGEPDRSAELVLVARDRPTGRPVACGALRPDGPEMIHRGDLGEPREFTPTAVALVSSLYVVPEHRRQGLARLVLAELELQARALGWFTLHIEARADQPAGPALCVAAGYALLDGPSDGRLLTFTKRLGRD
jgi:GNAT superfamily N-acetyltransferase